MINETNLKKPILFILSTFLITYTCWWILVAISTKGISENGEPLFMVLYLLGGLGPTVGPFIAIALTDRNFKEYGKRLLKWKVNIGWYFFAMFFILVLELVSIGLSAIATKEFTLNLEERWYMWFGYLGLMLIGGGLEEFGWRGVGNHEIGKKYNSIITSLVIGIIWFAWHLPLFFIPGVYQYQTSILLFACSTVVFAFFLTFLYNNTGSILLCIIMHVFSNATHAWGFSVGNTIMLTDRISLEGVIEIGVFFVAGIILIVIFGHQFMSKKEIPPFLTKIVTEIKKITTHDEQIAAEEKNIED